MRFTTAVMMFVLYAGSVCAKPSMDKGAEARGFLLDQKDVPALKMSYVKPGEWIIPHGENNTKYDYVTSARQRWWRQADQTEVMVEVGIFPSTDDTLKAAELRVKTLKQRKSLQEEVLKGGQLPGQARGDRAWGLLDPPETGAEPNRCKNVGPLSTFAAVVFVKKDVCVQVSAESLTTNINLDDLEQLAKKIATKIKTDSNPEPKRQSEPTGKN